MQGQRGAARTQLVFEDMQQFEWPCAIEEQELFLMCAVLSKTRQNMELIVFGSKLCGVYLFLQQVLLLL